MDKLDKLKKGQYLVGNTVITRDEVLENNDLNLVSAYKPGSIVTLVNDVRVYIKEVGLTDDESFIYYKVCPVEKTDYILSPGYIISENKIKNGKEKITFNLSEQTDDKDSNTKDMEAVNRNINPRYRIDTTASNEVISKQVENEVSRILGIKVEVYAMNSTMSTEIYDNLSKGYILVDFQDTNYSISSTGHVTLDGDVRVVITKVEEFNRHTGIGVMIRDVTLKPWYKRFFSTLMYGVYHPKNLNINEYDEYIDRVAAKMNELISEYPDMVILKRGIMTRPTVLDGKEG